MNINNLGLTDKQKAKVLEWVALELSNTKVAEKFNILREGKSYDPLTIDTERKIAHSYVMDMWDGGRHHKFKNYKQVADTIFKEFLRKF